MTTKDEVIAMHREHPDWTSGEIARALKCGGPYVVATFHRNGLKLPGGKERRIPVARTVAQERERCARIAEFFDQPKIAAAIRRGAEIGVETSNQIEKSYVEGRRED